MTQREIAEIKAGHPHMLNDVAGRAHDYGGYTVCFQMPCDQTDRLVTHGSRRYQERNVCCKPLCVR